MDAIVVTCVGARGWATALRPAISPMMAWLRQPLAPILSRVFWEASMLEGGRQRWGGGSSGGRGEWEEVEGKEELESSLDCRMSRRIASPPQCGTSGAEVGAGAGKGRATGCCEGQR